MLKIPEGPSDWKNWTSAQEFCVEEGGTLVAIENEVEQGSVLNVQYLLKCLLSSRLKDEINMIPLAKRIHNIVQVISVVKKFSRVC